MRTLAEISGLIQDGKITTRAEAEALLEEESAAAAAFYQMPQEEVRRRLKSNIGYLTGYFSHAEADRIMDLFDTEHPIFKRKHPTAEEALELGMNYTASRIKEKD
jgi:hypothetical protein